jgi:hypothetical protein
MRKVAVIAVMGACVVALPAVGAPIPTGFARITVDEGCLARVVKGPYKKVVSGRTELPTGTYRITVRPTACKAVPRKITVRERRTVKAKVVMVTPAPVTP